MKEQETRFSLSFQQDSTVLPPEVVLRGDEDSVQPLLRLLKQLQLSQPGVLEKLDQYLNDAMSDSRQEFIWGRKGTQKQLLKVAEIQRFYTKNGAVFAQHLEFAQGSFRAQDFRVSAVLKEIEDLDSFVRISHGEVANLRHVHHFEAEIRGLLVVVYRTGERSYVSRRQVGSLRRIINDRSTHANDRRSHA